MGFTARLQWSVLASRQLGQAWQWETRRQMVEVQELCHRQHEQDIVRDLWAEKIVCRCRQASRGLVSEKKRGPQAGKPHSSTPGRGGIQACSSSCRKGLPPTCGSAGERLRLQSWQGEAGQTESGIESNARGRRGFRERQECDNRKDCRDKAGMAENKPTGARIDAARRHASHARSSERRKRRKPWRWLSVSSRNQTWRSHASNANCTIWKHTPAEEDAREAIPESTPTSATHVNQNEGSEKTSWRGKSRRVRRDLGINE